MVQIPDSAAVAKKLKPLNYRQLEGLARLSGVPFHTLRKIRDCETRNPRIETVRMFWPHVAAACKASA